MGYLWISNLGFLFKDILNDNNFSWNKNEVAHNITSEFITFWGPMLTFFERPFNTQLRNLDINVWLTIRISEIIFWETTKKPATSTPFQTSSLFAKKFSFNLRFFAICLRNGVLQTSLYKLCTKIFVRRIYLLE